MPKVEDTALQQKQKFEQGLVLEETLSDSVSRIAGRLKFLHKNWKGVTSDLKILS